MKEENVRRLLYRWPTHEAEAFEARIGRFIIRLDVDCTRGDAITIYPCGEGVPESTQFVDRDLGDVFASDLSVVLTGVVPSLWEESGVTTEIVDYRHC